MLLTNLILRAVDKNKPFVVLCELAPSFSGLSTEIGDEVSVYVLRNEVLFLACYCRLLCLGLLGSASFTFFDCVDCLESWIVLNY